jgi:hypothetical protein
LRLLMTSKIRSVPQYYLCPNHFFDILA